MIAFDLVYFKVTSETRKISINTGPLLFVFDEAIFQHEIRNFGLFQAKTNDYGL